MVVGAWSMVRVLQLLFEYYTYKWRWKIASSPCSMLIPPTFTSHSFDDNGWEIITKVILSESLCVICVCEREKHTVYAGMYGLVTEVQQVFSLNV